MISYNSNDFYINTTKGIASISTMHYHNTYDIYYTHSGSREYFVEDKIFTASTGSFVLIPAQALHRINSGDVLRTLVSFTDDFLLEHFSPKAAKQLLKCFEMTLIYPSAYEQTLFQNLLTQLKTRNTETMSALYLGIFLESLSNCEPVCQFADNRVTEIIKFVNQNFGNLYTIEQIAKEMHFSTPYLCKIFKKAMGITLMNYINNIKIKNACALLDSSDKTITEISHLSGFHSSAYFCTLFKKFTSLSPTQYRDKYQHQKN